MSTRRFLPSTTGKLEDPTHERVRKNLDDRITELQKAWRDLATDIESFDSGGGSSGGAPSGTGLVRVNGGTYGARSELSGDVTTSGSLATAIGANKVTDAKLRQSAGLSVIGRSANSTGNVADIVASADGYILQRSGSALVFGPPPTLTANPVGIFGDGFDGNVTFDGAATVLGIVPSAGVYILLRDICPNDMTVNAGVIVYTAGYRVIGKGTLTCNGAIQWNGNAGSGVTAGVAQTNTFYNGGLAGGAGGASGSGSGGSASTAVPGGRWATVASPAVGTGPGSPGNTGNRGQGGTGGGAGVASNGGTAGALTTSAANLGTSWPLALFRGCLDAAGAVKFTMASGGGGGSGGGAGSPGGGGGGGAGNVGVAFRVITGAGSITANGGAGGNGAITTGTGGGGGGGGGGGIANVFYATRSGSLTITANGGTGGTGIGTGANGGAGGVGSVLLNNTSGDGT